MTVPSGSGTTLIAACAALGDETRWRVLELLGDAPASATALAARLPVTRQAVARHLEVLRRAGLVEAERHGHEVRYAALGSRLSELARDLDRHARAWDDRLARVKRLAEAD